MQKRIRLGIVAPGRAIDKKIEHSVSALAADTYGETCLELVFHPQCFSRSGHFAGSDNERAEAFVEMSNDPELDAIWFARGGYGSCRLLDIAFKDLGPAARRKTYLGYSDTGSLLARLYKDSIGTVAHGPMPADITRTGGEAAILRVLSYFLDRDRKNEIEASTREPGCYAAFNITVLANLIGTPWVPDLTDHILMLEEVSEYHYSLDRMLFNITSSPSMRNVSGIQLGRCNAIPDNDIDFEATEEEIAKHWCTRNSIPFLGRADIGHDVDNKIVVFGTQT